MFRSCVPLLLFLLVFYWSAGGGTEFVTVVNEGEARYFFRQFVKTTTATGERGGETSVARSRAFRSLGHVRPLSSKEERRKRKEREREGKKPRRETKESLEAGGSLSTQPRRHVGTPADTYITYTLVMRVARRNAHRGHVIQARIRIPRYLAGVGKRLRRILPNYRAFTYVSTYSHCFTGRNEVRGSRRKSEKGGGGKVMEKR